ncbi:MAG: response regulator [Acidobacteria bacterium]|nr:response regulator [Acidobacteriota bacterium]
MIRTLIVDDEAPARRKIRDLLTHEADIEVVGEAADGAVAVDLIRTTRPELVFLDIQMPRLDGFGVIDAIGAEIMPLVVFITAYDEHALRAFDVHALDYLLKPFAPSRFQQVLQRIRKRLHHADTLELASRLGQLLETLRAEPRYLRHLFVEKGHEREILLQLETVDLIQSEKNYMRFIAREGEYIRRGTLNALEARLDPEKFMRVNRSEIVRLEAVREFQPWFHGDYRVIMKDGRMLTWSRRYRARVRGDFA